MSRFGRLLLALLASLGLLFLWGGTSIASAAPTAEECASEAPPPDCPASDDGQPAGGDMGSPPVAPPVTPPDAVDPAGDGSGGGSDATPPGSSTQPEQKPDTDGAVVPAYTGADALDDCQSPTDFPDCLVPTCDPTSENPLCTDPPPACDQEQLTDCVPCDVEPFSSLPSCDPTPPPTCTDITQFPDCTPDCDFVAGLLGADGCSDLPDCIDLSALPEQFKAVLAQLPKEITDKLPVCAPAGGGENPGGGGTPTPVTTPVDNSPGVYYENCDAAREAGAAPINRGEPGYRSELDRDDDGVACEDDTVNAQPISDTGQLAYTGTDPKPMLAAGGGLLLLGAGLLRLGRRRA